MQSILTFKDAKGGVYEVPENELAEFQKALPDAIPTTTYKGGNGKMYSVPTTDTERFMQSVPDAKPALQIKTDDGQKFGVPVSDAGEFYDWYKNAPEMKKEREATRARSGAGQFAKDVAGGVADAFTKPADVSSMKGGPLAGIQTALMDMLGSASGAAASISTTPLGNAFDFIADKMGLAGEDRKTAFGRWTDGIAEASKEYGIAADELAGDVGPVGNVIRGVNKGAGSLAGVGPAYAVAAPTLGLATLPAFGALEASATGDWKQMALAAAKGLALGSVMRGMGNMPRPVRASAGAAAFGGLTAAEGGSIEDVVTSSVMGAGLSAMGGKGRSMKEVKADVKTALKPITDSNWYRKATIKERGLMTQTIAQQVSGLRANGMSEGQALREIKRIYGTENKAWQDAFNKRSQGEFKTPVVAPGETPAPSPATELQTWATLHPEQALEIAKMKVPSRGAFEKAGLPRVPQDERIAMAGTLSDMSAEIETNLASAQAAKAQQDQAEIEAQKQRSAESRDAQERGAKIEKVMNDLDEVSAGIPDNDPVFAENQGLIEEIGAAIQANNAGLVVEKVNVLTKKIRNRKGNLKNPQPEQATATEPKAAEPAPNIAAEMTPYEGRTAADSEQDFADKQGEQYHADMVSYLKSSWDKAKEEGTSDLIEVDGGGALLDTKAAVPGFYPVGSNPVSIDLVWSQRKGAGREVMREAALRAVSLNRPMAWSKPEPGAMGFYRKLGFKPVDRVGNFFVSVKGLRDFLSAQAAPIAEELPTPEKARAPKSSIDNNQSPTPPAETPPAPKAKIGRKGITKKAPKTIEKADAIVINSESDLNKVPPPESLKHIEGTAAWDEVSDRIEGLQIAVERAKKDGDSEKIRTAIRAFDGNLFGQYKNSLTELQSIREHLSPIINKILGDGYSISWASPSSVLDLSTQIQNVENGEGTVFYARTAEIRSKSGALVEKGLVETVAPTDAQYTALDLTKTNPPKIASPTEKGFLSTREMKELEGTVEYRHVNSKITRLAKEIASADNDAKITRVSRAIEAIDTALTESFGDNARVLEQMRQFVTSEFQSKAAEYINFAWPEKGATFDAKTMKTSTGEKNTEGEVLSAKSVITTTVGGSIISKSMVELAEPTPLPAETPPAPKAKIGRKGVTKKAVEEENEFTIERLKGPHKSIADRIRKISGTLQDLGTNKGTRPLDTKWVQGAIKRLLKNENIMPDKQGGEFASAKIALSKATTIEQLNAIADKLESKAPNDDVKPPATAPSKKIGAKGVTKKAVEIKDVSDDDLSMAVAFNAGNIKIESIRESDRERIKEVAKLVKEIDPDNVASGVGSVKYQAGFLRNISEGKNNVAVQEKPTTPAPSKKIGSKGVTKKPVPPAKPAAVEVPATAPAAPKAAETAKELDAATPPTDLRASREDFSAWIKAQKPKSLKELRAEKGKRVIVKALKDNSIPYIGILVGVGPKNLKVKTKSMYGEHTITLPTANYAGQYDSLIDFVTPSAKAVASGEKNVPIKKTVSNTVKAPLENVSDKDKARATEIKAKLAKMRNRMSFGVDPEFLSLGTELTTIYIKGGVKTFKQYASVMKQELGEASAELKGNLRMLWEKAAVDYPDIEDISRKESEAIIAELDSVDPLPSPEPKIGSKGATRKTVKRKPELGDEVLGKVTSLRESVAEVERTALAYPAEVKDAARRFPEVVDKAWDRINKNPDAGQNLIDELSKEARPLRDYEVAMLTIVKQQRFNERQKALEEVKLAENGTEAEKAEAAKRLEVAAEKLEEVFAVAERGANKSITETARGLVALKMLMSDKYELVEMEQSVRDSQGGKPLNDKQQSELARIKAEYDATRKTLDEEIDRLNKTVGSLERDIADAQATAKYSAMIDEILNGGGIKLKVSDRMLAYADKLEKEALDGMRKAATRMSSGVDPMALVNATKLGTAYFIRLSAKGTASFEVWADKMREDFGSDSDKIEPYLKRIFMDAFSDANKHIEIKTQAPKAKPQTSEEIIGQIKELPAIDDKVLSTNIKDLYRLQVAEGVTVLDEATENVNAQLREAGIDMTNEQVRDIFSDYGKSRPVTKDEAKLILADMRRQAQLVASIERVMQDLAPLKTGQQRPRPTSTTRELSRKLNKLLKEAGINVVDRETTLATALQSMKTRLNNSIEDMTKAIASNERMTENRSILNLDEEAKELVARRDELRKQYEEVFPRKPLTDQQRLDIAVRATERSLKEWNERLENAKKGIFTKPEKESGYSQNEFIKAIKAERDSVKAEVARLKEIAYPRRTPTQIAIDNKRKGLERSIVEMRRRIKENDFAPRKRHVIDGSGDEAFLEAQARHKMVKIEFDKIKEAARWRELSPTSKAIEIATEVYDMARNIAYSADDSFLGRQGWFYMMSHPVKWLGAGTKSMKAFSRKQSRKQGEKFSERPNSRNGLYKKAGLELNEINETGDVQEADDMFRMNLTRKIPGVGQVVDASGRSFATASNEIRGSFFDSLLNNTKRGRRIQADPANLSKEDIAFLEDIAWGVNVLSGRSTLGHAEGAARVLGAPRFIKATFDTILHRPITRPLFKGDYAAAGSFAKEYLRAYAVLSAIYIVANLFLGDDDKTEWDPRSSKFGNIKISDGYSINPMAAIAPQIRFLARLITGQKKTGKGVKNLRKSFLPFASETEKLDKVAYGDSQWSDTGMYLRTKLHPGLNAAAGVLTGEDFWGNERSRWKLLAGSFLPISPVQAVEAYQAKGAVSGVAVGVSEFFGLSTNPNFNDPDILRQTAGSEEKFAEQIGAKLYAASGPGTDAESRKNMRDFVLGMKKSGTTDAEIYAMLEAEQKSKGLSTKKTENGGRRSSYGRRLQNVKEILAGADAPDAATMRDTGLAIYKATEKTSTPEEIAKAKEVMASMSLPEKVKALKYAMKEYGESSTDKSGKFTDAYRKRLILLKSIK